MEWQPGDNSVVVSESVFSFPSIACKSTNPLRLVVSVGLKHFVSVDFEHGRDLLIVQEDFGAAFY